MSTDICKAIFRKLAADGTVFTPNVFRTLKPTYYRARSNLRMPITMMPRERLQHRPHQEERAIDTGSPGKTSCGRAFLFGQPHETPFIPTWELRVPFKRHRIFCRKLREARAADDLRIHLITAVSFAQSKAIGDPHA